MKFRANLLEDFCNTVEFVNALHRICPHSLILDPSLNVSQKVSAVWRFGDSDTSLSLVPIHNYYEIRGRNNSRSPHSICIGFNADVESCQKLLTHSLILLGLLPIGDL